jgi:hypothetical protein
LGFVAGRGPSAPHWRLLLDFGVHPLQQRGELAQFVGLRLGEIGGFAEVVAQRYR